jgi:peptide-N4-(N-acetyl-beta-glucosaminyl)asparagine amidase
MGGNVKRDWGYQDCMIRSLLRWVPLDCHGRSFHTGVVLIRARVQMVQTVLFARITNPYCSTCSSPAGEVRVISPRPEELAMSARRVELINAPRQTVAGSNDFPESRMFGFFYPRRKIELENGRIA